MKNLELLINELIKYKDEVEWLEFKHNNYDPKMIGEDICALANSAALHDKNCAYMLWGITDGEHKIVGTKYNLQTLKKGNQELDNWLRYLLSKNADYEFHTVNINNVDVGILIIHRAVNQTVMFEKTEYIRIGSYTKKLNEFPALQAKLWDKLRNSRFEDRYAKTDLSLNEIMNYIDFSIYFTIKNEPAPSTVDNFIYYMLEEQVVEKMENGLYAITNLGAILFAKRLSDFPRLSRKSVRIAQYADNSRLNLLKEDTINTGYAIGFNEMFKYIGALLPSEEIINGVVRKTETEYPMIAVREAVANALIHQDFSVAGAGPVVEIFENRIEITNPGQPLIDINRIIDNPPRSRNEKLAALMRRLKMCEELGTGWDKITLSCEIKQLPAPKIYLYEENTKVTLFNKIPFSDISSSDKMWACYLHACIKYVQGEYLTNSSLRDRFGLQESSSGSVSRLIKDAVANNMIKPFDPTTAPRYMKYLPVWA